MWARNIVFLLILQLCFTFDVPRKCMSDVKINDDRYNVSEIYKLGDQVIPTDAHYDSYGNLFYVESTSKDDGYHFNINVIKSQTTTPQKVLGLPEGTSYSIAVDVKNTKVYFGTAKGLYTYNYDSHTAAHLSNITLKLNMIFVDKNSNKYFIENVDGIHELYQLVGETKVLCHSMEALNEMAINGQNDFYFIRQNKLFVRKSREQAPTCIGDVAYDGNAQISFYKNSVFVASDTLSYFHENDAGNLHVVENVPGSVTAIAFDQVGEFVLGIEGKFIKYKKNECYLRKNSRVVDEYSTAI